MSVRARFSGLARSGLVRARAVGRWTYARAHDAVGGLAGIVGFLVWLGLLTGYVQVLKLTVPGVLDWIDNHSLDNGEIWFVEIVFVGLVPVLALAFVVSGVRRLARKVARVTRR